MIVKAISDAHYALVQRVCFDQWYLQKCHGRLRAVEIISTPPDVDAFKRFVFELVHNFSFETSSSFLNFTDFQRHLRQLSSFARTFGAILELANLDLSIFQEAVSTAIAAPELHEYLPDAVGYLCDMTTLQQRDWEGFARWYHDMLELAVFGTEDNPIFVEE